MQKDYEIIYLLSKKNDKEKIKDIVNSLIAEFNGKIIEETLFPKEKFAYLIKKESSGYFLITHFLMLPQNIAELDKKLKLQKEILRFMITAKKEIKEKMILPKKEKRITLKKDLKKEKVDLEEIDKKIDEILKENIA